MTIGILNAGAPASDVESEWTAQIYRCDNGMNIGMTRFWPAAMVYDGTDEELVWRLVAMVPGARVERRTTSSGVITHLVRSDHRVDTRAMLASVGLNVSNTNPTAHHPLQSFITHGTTVATTPTHRDENDAILVQLRGSKEMLIHPPAFALPGVPASVFGDAAGFQNPQWLEFDPFRLGRIHSSAVGEGGADPGRCSCGTENVVARSAIDAGLSGDQRPNSARHHRRTQCQTPHLQARRPADANAAWSRLLVLRCATTKFPTSGQRTWRQRPDCLLLCTD